MNLTLPSRMQTWIERRVRQGVYASPDALIREAVRRLQGQEKEQAAALEKLREDLRKGLADAKEDRLVPFTSERMQEARRTGRRRLGRSD
jgi:antitoxin ParD1/3/4